MATHKDSYPGIFLPATDADLPEKTLVGFEKYSDFRPINRGEKVGLYSCWDCITGRTIVVKKLHPEFAKNPAERRRLLREARITAQLQHPNTVPLYEIGETHGSIYFTMKRIAGENLFQVLQRLSWGDAATEAKYPLDILLEQLIQIGLALAYAHTHGVIHRDVKPENIWVGEFGEVVLLDWGVAKVWGFPNQDGEDSPHQMSSEKQRASEKKQQHSANNSDTEKPQLQTLTRTGQRPGTPLYMSPEQVLAHKYLDERTDIFSLGVVMYELLAFKEPFRGRVIQETFDNIIHNTPPSIRALRPEKNIPELLETIVFKALEKKPADRFPQMIEMVEAIRQARREL